MKLTAKLFQILSVLCEVPVSSPHGSRSSILAIWLPPLPTLSGRFFSAHCLVPLASHEMVSWHTVDSASSLTLSTAIQGEQHFLRSASPQFRSGSLCEVGSALT